jgi:hypothetical protein
LVGVQLAAKSSLQLSVVVTLKAQKGQVRGLVVTGVLIEVMDLDGLTRIPTDATGSVRVE